jgi:hypothetical protein
MFPGAPDPQLPAGSPLTLAQRSLAYLRQVQAAGRTTVQAKEVAETLGVKWPALRQALRPFLDDLPDIGWRFIPGERGKGKARPEFEVVELSSHSFFITIARPKRTLLWAGTSHEVIDNTGEYGDNSCSSTTTSTRAFKRNPDRLGLRPRPNNGDTEDRERGFFIPLE